MKITLLKKEQILSLIIFVFLSTPAINAQNSSNQEEEPMQRMGLELYNVDGPDTRRALHLSFSEFTSDEFDSDYDVKNLDVLENDLNLILDGDPMIEQAYGPITEDKIVNLLFQASGSYTFRIKLTETENMEGQDIHIRDNFTGAYFDLKTGESFEFTSDAGVFSNRFEILFKTQSETLSQTDYDLEGLDVYYSMNTNNLVILNANNVKLKRIDMFNVSGQSIYSNTSLNNTSADKFQLSNISTGIYIVRLTTDDNRLLTKKIMAK